MDAKQLKLTLFATFCPKAIGKKVSEEKIAELQKLWFKLSSQGSAVLQDTPDYLQQQLSLSKDTLLYDAQKDLPEEPGYGGVYLNQKFVLIKFIEGKCHFEMTSLKRREYRQTFEEEETETQDYDWTVLEVEEMTLLEIFKYSPNIVNDILDTWEFQPIMKSIKLI
tara:strand:- start:91 stop:588 length:498 start_codon:yes stop_codon:yes gene_type:complete